MPLTDAKVREPKLAKKPYRFSDPNSLFSLGSRPPEENRSDDKKPDIPMKLQAKILRDWKNSPSAK